MQILQNIFHFFLFYITYLLTNHLNNLSTYDMYFVVNIIFFLNWNKIWNLVREKLYGVWGADVKSTPGKPFDLIFCFVFDVGVGEAVDAVGYVVGGVDALLRHVDHSHRTIQSLFAKLNLILVKKIKLKNREINRNSIVF